MLFGMTGFSPNRGSRYYNISDLFTTALELCLSVASPSEKWFLASVWIRLIVYSNIPVIISSQIVKDEHGTPLDNTWNISGSCVFMNISLYILRLYWLACLIGLQDQIGYNSSRSENFKTRNRIETRLRNRKKNQENHRCNE